MCGIAGIVGEVECIESILEKMSKAQAHRGPDCSDSRVSLFADAQIGLAYNQLKREYADFQWKQPFWDSELGLAVVFDGKLHNTKELTNLLSQYYIFTTKYPAELLLKAYHRWGKECVKHIEGIFAFAIHDQSAQHLFIARDHLGIKPLYYSLYKGNFYFSSEIKALFAAGIPKRLSAKQWATLFQFSDYGIPGSTFWEGVYELPAGHSLIVDDWKVKLDQWYRITDEIYKTAIPDSEQRVSEEIFRLATNGILKNLHADVPVGLHTADEQNTQLLLELIGHAAPKKSFKVFSYYCKQELKRGISSTNKLSDHRNFRVEEIYLSPKMIQNEAIRIIPLEDEPFDGLKTLASARLFRIARKRGLNIVCSEYGFHETWNAELTDIGCRSESVNSCLMPQFAALAEKPDHLCHNTQISYMDMLINYLYRKIRFNERAAMAYSVELRNPFIDHQLMEFLFALFLCDQHQALKQNIYHRILDWANPRPAIQIAPTVRSTEIPEQKWLTGELIDWVDRSLYNIAHSETAAWFDWERVEKQRNEFRQGAADCHHLLWKWINLSELLKSQ